MKLLHSVPAGNGSLTFFLPKGQYGMFFIEFDVTAATGVTLTRKDFGNIIFNWNGQDVVNVDAEILNLLNNVYGGTSEFTANAGAKHRLTVFMPAGLWFDSRNIYDIGDNDKVYFKLDFKELSDSAKVTSGSVNIYAKNRVGVMGYLHHITSRNVVASGASVIADSHPINNIANVYLKNPASLLSNVQIVKDGETIVDASPSTLIAYSDFIHQLESTNNTLAIDFTESKDVRESVGATLSYKYNFSGAGTLEQYFSFIEFTPVKAVQSQQKAREKLKPVSASFQVKNRAE